MSLHQSVLEMWHPDRRDTMAAAYPLISQLLAQVIVLPASSAEVERVFSTMTRTKTPLRNRLTTSMLDNLIRISMDGPDSGQWDPVPAALKWKSMGNRKIKLFRPVPVLSSLTNDSDGCDDSDWCTCAFLIVPLSLSLLYINTQLGSLHNTEV